MQNSVLLKKLCPKDTKEQEKIYSGLCSKHNFDKILNGEKEPDELLMKSLLERLGKSPEKFDIILHVDDYSKMELQEKIRELIEEEKYQLAEKKLNQYEEEMKQHETLRLQKKSQLKAQLFFKKKEYKKSYEEIKIAFHYTKKGMLINDKLCESIWKNPMTVTEIELLQQLMEIYDKLGNKEESYEIAKKMERFLDKFITDKELLVQVYSYAVLFLGKKAYEFQEYEKCVFYCEKGIRCLRETESLKYAVEIFELKAKAMKKGKIGREREWKQAYFEAYSIASIYHDKMEFIQVVEKEIEEDIWEFIQLEK